MFKTKEKFKKITAFFISLLLSLFLFLNILPSPVFADNDDETNVTSELKTSTDTQIKEKYKHYICEYKFILHKNQTKPKDFREATYTVEWEDGLIIKCHNKEDKGKENTSFDIAFPDIDKNNTFKYFTTTSDGKGSNLKTYKTEYGTSWSDKVDFKKVGSDSIMGTRYIVLFAQWSETEKPVIKIPTSLSEIDLKNYELYITKSWSWFYTWICDIYGAGVTGHMNSILEFDVENKKTITGSVWERCMGICGILLPLAYVLIILYFLIDLMSLLSTEMFNLERLFKSIIKLTLLFIVVQYLPEILSGVLQLCNVFTKKVNVLAKEIADNSADLDVLKSWAEKLDDDPFFLTKLKYFGEIVVYYILFLAVKFSVYTVLVSRILEIGIRAALMPLAIPDILTNGMHSEGYMYIKKFLAVCFYGAVVAFICVFYNLAHEIPGLGVLLSRIVLSLTLMMLLKQSRGVVDNIFGVH